MKKTEQKSSIVRKILNVVLTIIVLAFITGTTIVNYRLEAQSEIMKFNNKAGKSISNCIKK